MRKLFRLALATGMSLGLLIGCAAPEPAYTPTPFTPESIDTSGSVSKVDAFVMIMDASSSMGGNRPTKFLYGKDIAGRMNQTIPALGYDAGLVAFGTGSCVKNKMAWNVHGPAPYDRAAVANGIAAVKCASGWSPLEKAIAASGEALSGEAGQSALIIISDFKELDRKAVVESATALKGAHGNRLCIYPVQIGDNAGGKGLADELASIGGCGSAVNADSIASSGGMAGFVRGVFLAPAPPPPVAKVADSDGDGVPDDRDKCPNTPKGVRVTSEGCWVLTGKDVLFEFNSAKLRDTYVLDEAAKILLREPGITGEVRGHTDSVGPEDYNMKLSVRRAESVLEYFVGKGVSRDRLRAKGFGESQPVASNDTPEGRALNRRVELKAD